MTTLEKLEELIYVGFKETDRKWQETDRKWQETDRKWQESLQERDRQWRETDAYLKEIAKDLAEDLKRTRQEVAKVSDALGRFAENMVAPAVVRIFNEAGIPITEVAQRVRSPLRRIEYDVLAVNNQYVVVISVKTRLKADHVRHFVEERLSIFKEVFPRYREMQMFGAVAGMSIEQEADIYAIKLGLYVLTQSGESVTLLNGADFQPRIF